MIFRPVLGVSYIRACRGQVGGSVAPLWGCREVPRCEGATPPARVQCCTRLRSATLGIDSASQAVVPSGSTPGSHSTVLQHRGSRGRVMSRHGSFILWGVGVHPPPRTHCVAFAMTHSHHPKTCTPPSVVETVRDSHVLAPHVLGLPGWVKGRQRAGKGMVIEWSTNSKETFGQETVKLS